MNEKLPEMPEKTEFKNYLSANFNFRIIILLMFKQLNDCMLFTCSWYGKIYK